MNEYLELGYFDILLACGFIIATIGISLALKLGLVRNLIIASLRTLLQLGLAGLLLGAVFKIRIMTVVLILLGVMILIASREAVARQKVRLKGSGLDAFISISISVILVGLTVTIIVVRAKPWWTPSIAIPLFGMIIGNSLNGITLTIDRFLSGCAQQRAEIETRLSLGASTYEASLPLMRDALRTGMTPIINSMMIVGIVALPGMMTGQLIAGAEPWDAVKYQMVVMYMITAATAFGSVCSVLLAWKRVFTDKDALRHDLTSPVQ